MQKVDNSNVFRNSTAKRFLYYDECKEAKSALFLKEHCLLNCIVNPKSMCLLSMTKFVVSSASGNFHLPTNDPTII